MSDLTWYRVFVHVDSVPKGEVHKVEQALATFDHGSESVGHTKQDDGTYDITASGWVLLADGRTTQDSAEHLNRVLSNYLGRVQVRVSFYEVILGPPHRFNFLGGTTIRLEEEHDEVPTQPRLHEAR